MDALIQRAIQLVKTTARSEVPWEFDSPWSQPCYRWSAPNDPALGEWQRFQPTRGDKGVRDDYSLLKLSLFSWNIDFMLPFADSRMRAAIRHLERHVAEQPSTTATVIFLNECVHSDLKLLAADPWVRQNFQLTDIDGANWQSGHYGTTTLIDRRLPIEGCFRVHYSQTRMERDGLFVDILLGEPGKVVRLCNTHLESLALEPSFRPLQMKVCAQRMHDSSVHGAVLAGDLNAIQDFDRHLHTVNDLKDAYLELGGSEDDGESGHTWGQQAATAQRDRFGTSRMDKSYYCGGLKCVAFERFGMDIEVEEAKERKEIIELGFDKPWITDHLGIKAEYVVVDKA